MFVGLSKSLLIIPGLHILFVWKNPYLEKLHSFFRVLIFLRMLNSCSCAHDLYIALLYYLHIAHIISVLQVTRCRNGNNFHVVVWMCAKTHAACDRVVI